MKCVDCGKETKDTVMDISAGEVALCEDCKKQFCKCKKCGISNYNFTMKNGLCETCQDDEF